MLHDPLVKIIRVSCVIGCRMIFQPANQGFYSLYKIGYTVSIEKPPGEKKFPWNHPIGTFLKLLLI